MNYNDIIKENKIEALALSECDHAEEFENRISLEAVASADKEFEELLNEIPDSELRHKLDLAAGRIAYAYTKLGFLTGYMTLSLILRR